MLTTPEQLQQSSIVPSTNQVCEDGWDAMMSTIRSWLGFHQNLIRQFKHGIYFGCGRNAMLLIERNVYKVFGMKRICKRTIKSKPNGKLMNIWVFGSLLIELEYGKWLTKTFTSETEQFVWSLGSSANDHQYTMHI